MMMTTVPPKIAVTVENPTRLSTRRVVLLDLCAMGGTKAGSPNALLGLTFPS
jgi:hypothetical protein